MTVRRLSRNWTQQPQVPVGIDWSNPLSDGAVLAVNFATRFDAVSGKFGVNSGSVPQIDTPYGRSAYCTGGANLAFSVPEYIGSFPPGCTVFLLFVPVSFVDYGCLFRKSGGAFDLSLSLSGSGSINYIGVNGGATGASGTTGFTLNKLCSVAMSYSDGSDIGLYANGNLTDTRAIGNSSNSSTEMAFGLGGGGYSNPDIKYIAAIIYRRKLSAREIRELSSNPWQIFAPQTRRRLISAGAGGSSTDLTVQEALHGHNADSLTFSMATYLAVAESLHNHTADNVALTSQASLSVA